MNIFRRWRHKFRVWQMERRKRKFYSRSLEDIIGDEAARQFYTQSEKRAAELKLARQI